VRALKAVLVRPYTKGAYTGAYGFMTPPLGLASLAGSIRDMASVYIIDAEAAGLENSVVADVIEDVSPDIVGFTTIASTYYGPSREIMRMLRSRGVDSLFIIGGHHATFTYPLALRDGFDVVVLGEGEVTFRELVKELLETGGFRNVRGIAYADGKEIHASYREPLRRLDALPMPAYDLLDRDLYRAPVFGEDARVATLEFSRGCPYNCEFCSASTMWGHVTRFKSYDRVLEELRYVRSLGYNWVFFTDDNFIPPHRVEYTSGLMKNITEKGLNNINYIVQVRADVIARKPWLAELMRDMGVKLAFIGVESGDPDVLKGMGKGLRVSDVVKATYVLSRAGIIIHAGVVVGAPYETSEARRRSYRFIDVLTYYGLDSVQYSIYTPLPGARAFINALNNNLLITGVWDHYTCLLPVMKVENSLLKPLKLLCESRFENYLFYFKRWLRGKLGVLKDFHKEYVDKASEYIIKNLGKHVFGFLTIPFTSTREYIRILESSKKTDWKGLALMKKIYEKHVAEYVKLYAKTLAIARQANV